MAEADDERFPCASGGAGEKSRKRPFRPETDEEPQNVSHEAGRTVSCLSTHQGGTFATFGKSELEQMLKQMTFTWSEAQHLIALLHSRTTDESPSSLLMVEALKTSGETPRQDSKLINNNATSTFLSVTSLASPKQPATLENLPEELLINIFIRILAKQLAQMRSVSKSWNALLSQPFFIKSHLHHSIHNNDQVLLVFHNKKEPKPFTTIPCRSSMFELTNFIKLPVNPQTKNINGIKVIGSVNGLICSRYGDSIIQIWNPSLSAVLTLPPYSIPSNDYDSLKIFFRFGYDPKTDDYKVVKRTGPTFLTLPLIYDGRWWLHTEIYSMRKGTWEMIIERPPSHIPYIIDDDRLCVDGHDGRFHWLAGGIKGKKYSRSIVAFDLGSETFHEIPLPDSSLEYNCDNVLGFLGEKLCVVNRVGNSTCEVWVMDEYGVAESWVKRFVFSQFSGITWPLGFTSQREFLIEVDDNLVLYDPFAKEQKLFDFSCTRKVVEYVDSLVWIAPVEHEMVDGGGQSSNGEM